MTEFERLQDEFQRGVMTGDDSVLAEILDSPKENRDVLFGVYKFAYGSRLVEALRSDHPYLHAYLGDEMFDTMGHAYVEAKPSQHPNLRWFSQGLPDFLKQHEPYSAHPVLHELAHLEKTLNDAFDAKDAPVVAVADLAGIAPEAWNALRFAPHPSAVRFDFATNAAAIWMALKNDQTPPDVELLDTPQRVVVWRQDTTPMWRDMAAEEAMMWDEAGGGIPFGVLCSMLATYDDPDGAAARGAGYLHNWVTTGMLSGVSVAE